jgi:hypothetical protein
VVNANTVSVHASGTVNQTVSTTGTATGGHHSTFSIGTLHHVTTGGQLNSGTQSSSYPTSHGGGSLHHHHTLF